MSLVEYGYLNYNSNYGYLQAPYLESNLFGEAAGFQTRLIANAKPVAGFQIRLIADNIIGGIVTNDYGFQTRLIADKLKTTGFQVTLIRNNSYGMQVVYRFYNLTQLRYMYDFPSRGTAALLGNNWTATSTATGDFLANNVNTDIVEQVWRSNNAPSSQTLTCDTGITQGITIDTIAILNHNLTSSALVQVQGSNDNFATPPSVLYNMTITTLNMFYIAPEFPKSSASKNRYWRFIIQDSTNPDGFLQIGTIVFGNAKIFVYPENFKTPLSFGTKHFKDVINTEGFTNVSNDRTLKKFLTLDFEKLDGTKGNFLSLKEMWEEVRTSLKILVIPTPTRPERFAVFAKLSEMPSETIESIDDTTEYIDIDLNFDESL
jgi:hypothetical protein